MAKTNNKTDLKNTEESRSSNRKICGISTFCLQELSSRRIIDDTASTSDDNDGLLIAGKHCTSMGQEEYRNNSQYTSMVVAVGGEGYQGNKNDIETENAKRFFATDMIYASSCIHPSSTIDGVTSKDVNCSKTLNCASYTSTSTEEMSTHAANNDAAPYISSEHKFCGLEGVHQPLFTVFCAVILSSEPLGLQLSNTPYGVKIDEVYENSQLQGKLRSNDYIVGYGCWSTACDMTVQGLTNYLAAEEGLQNVYAGQHHHEKIVIIKRFQPLHCQVPPCTEMATKDLDINRKDIISTSSGLKNDDKSADGCHPQKEYDSDYSMLSPPLCCGMYFQITKHGPRLFRHSTGGCIKNDCFELNKSVNTKNQQFMPLCPNDMNDVDAVVQGVPLNNVSHNDVICGRGGLGNRHPGNRRYRQIIKDYQVKYLKAQKKEKKKIALEIVDVIHSSQPPGKFLQKDNVTGLFFEIDDKRASEKVSQSLREGAPSIRSTFIDMKDCSSQECMNHHQTRSIIDQTEMKSHDCFYQVKPKDNKLSVKMMQKEDKKDDDNKSSHQEIVETNCKRKYAGTLQYLDDEATVTIKKARANTVVDMT